ncbi:ParA family protein [Proteobacteria bacterium 005FR1]|nr:ParA family protein [Proteobacteria bacterium 005FR1]
MQTSPDRPSHKSHVYAVTNQKGGVGKTTTCVNLAASLVATKKRVLLVDMDPQGNATMGSGVDKADLEQSVYDCLTEAVPAREVIVRSEAGGYDVLPANGDLTAAEVQMLSLTNKERRLQQALDAVRSEYDYILIDCPPSLNMLTVNALTACDGVIIPMQCEYYALEGLSALVNTIRQIQQVVNPKLVIEGLLRTMYDPRNSLTTEVSQQLHEHFGSRVYRTCIPRNVRLAEAPSYGMPALAYDKQSKGALAYLTLAGEIIRRNDLAEKDARLAVESRT